ncbi:MAG: hypothetical protein K2O16_12055 [Lachnospiraceae bacterium]|nr:hypothetical protein [Lachnospiraceae bacterium]
MIKPKTKRAIMILYVLAVLLMAGCGKEEVWKEVPEMIVEDIPAKELPQEEAGTKEGDILEEELPEEEGKQQNNSQGIPEARVTQSEPEASGDGAGQDAGQKKMPEEEEKDTKSARLQKYQTVLTDIIEKHTYPDGTDCGFGGTDVPSGNKFAIFDVDKDGGEELILYITSSSMAGMREVVYDYDEKTDTVREEYSGFPGGNFYENGLIEEGLSHNQGMAPLGDFWPYMLHRYQSESDSYQCTFIVDAWEKEFMAQDYEGNPYPEEIDEEKSGIVYYLMEGGTYDTASTVPVCKKVYEEWRKEQGFGSARIEIPFQPLTKENAGNI